MGVAIMWFSFGIFFLYQFLTTPLGWISLFLVIVTVVSSIVVIRFMRSANKAEQVFVNRTRLDIIELGLFKRKVASYDITKISNLRFNEKPQYSKHPLAGESFDYFGFQTEEKVIQDLFEDGRISFDYEGKQVKFGKDAASWEFEELEILLYDVTGNDLRYTDEYEKKHFNKEN